MLKTILGSLDWEWIPQWGQPQWSLPTNHQHGQAYREKLERFWKLNVHIFGKESLHMVEWRRGREKDEWCQFKGLQKHYSFFTLTAKLRMFISALTSALPPAHCFFMVYSSWWKQLQTILYWETGIGSAISYYIAPVHTWFTLDGISIHWSLWSVFAKKKWRKRGNSLL